MSGERPGRLAAWMRDRRGLVFAVPAGALAALLVAAAFNLDRGSGEAPRRSRIDEAQELLAPQRASADELARAAGSLADQTSVSLAAGAWIQVADEAGRLAQQYSATRLDPLPGSQLSMTEPRANVYLRDGRVLALASRKGIAHVPRRALESGTLEDDVEVRLFRPRDGAAVDVDRDAPAVVVSAEQAEFDGILGEVRCERAVRVVTDAGSFAGEGLTLRLDGEGDGVEQLIVDRATEPIRIERLAASGSAGKGAGGSQEAAAADSAGSSSTASEVRPRFYRLTLEGGVEVVRVRDGVTSIVRGERLVAVFSLESRGLDDVAFVPRPNSVAPPAPAALAIVPLVFASAPAVVHAADQLTVHFGGRLMMVPTTDPSEQLASVDDVRFDVVGPRVEAIDGRSRTRVVCTRLRYGVRDALVEAEGSDAAPLVVTNPRMSLEGRRFRAALDAGEGRIEGAGRLGLGKGPADAVSLLGEMPAHAVDAARMLVSADPAAVALVAARPRQQAPGDFRFDPSTQEIEIVWKDGVDLRFSGDGDAARLSLARFGGGVNVYGRQFELDSQSLEVAFSPADAEKIDAIVADGGTRVRRLGAEGGMRAERLELFLGAGVDGDTIPRRLVARKGVEARDERQTIWTDELVVGFREKPNGSAGEATSAPPGAAGPALSAEGVDVESVEAKGGVQILLKEGARVFADELLGDAAKRRLRLTGSDVAIVRSNFIADNLRDVRFDDATHSARSDGPGRFRAFRRSVALGEGRVARPEPEGAPTLDATWRESLEYSEPDPGRGMLDVRGEVRVRSRPSDRTSDAVDAQAILLELGLDPRAKDPATAERTLDQFIAKGSARLESRTWPDDARRGEPRVFRVSGEHVEYDMRSREGLVVGDGAVFVNLPKPPADEGSSPAPERSAGAIGLGLDGTTRFRWKRRMDLRRQFDDVFGIAMEGDVEMLHAGLRVDDALSMRCDRLEATVRRPEPAKDDAPTKDSSDAPGADGLARGVDLGGPAELLGVKGTGSVYVRTSEHDVECGEFDYSVQTGIATLTAAPGRTVTIATRGQPAPIRAQQVTWDLRNGRLQVSKASGSAGR